MQYMHFPLTMNICMIFDAFINDFEFYETRRATCLAWLSMINSWKISLILIS